MKHPALIAFSFTAMGSLLGASAGALLGAGSFLGPSLLGGCLFSVAAWRATRPDDDTGYDDG